MSEPSGQLYSRLLLPKGHGHPLARPQPFDNFPRRDGVEIGDVGAVTFDGSFDVFFNIRRHDDPANCHGLPDGYEVVPLASTDLASRASYHRKGSDVSNKFIHKRRLDVHAGLNVFTPVGGGATISISTSSKRTAGLLLPDGASRTDLRFTNKFKDQAVKHAPSWYAFLGSLGHEIKNGDLYLITGVDKSSSWCLFAVDEHTADNSVSLKLNAAQVGSAGGSYHWEWETGATFSDSGPRRPPGEQSDLKNQTVFFRGFKIMLPSLPFQKLPQVVLIADPKSPKLGQFIPSKFPPRSRSGTSSSGVTGNRVEHASGGGTHDEGSNFRTSVQVYHPADVVNKYLLDHSPDAVVAVTHDDEWASALKENEEEIPEESELIRRILAKYNVNVDAGGAYLNPLGMDPAFNVHSEGTGGGLTGEKPADSDVCGPESQQTGDIGEKHEVDGTDGADGIARAVNLPKPLILLDNAALKAFFRVPGTTIADFCALVGDEIRRLLERNGLDEADGVLSVDELDPKDAGFRLGLKWALKTASGTFGRDEAPKTEGDNELNIAGGEGAAMGADMLGDDDQLGGTTSTNSASIFL